MQELDPRLDKLIESICDFESVDWELVEQDSSGLDAELLVAVREFAAVSSASLSLQDTPVRNSLPAGAIDVLAPGTKWGNLEILDWIGEGASASVYLAHDHNLDRDVALKLFHPWHTPVGERSRALVEEGRLLARVNHPNVVTVYGADERDGRVGMWMELVRGRTLSDIVSVQGRMSCAEAMTVGIEICKALAAVHNQRLVHGDIKAQNVMRDQNGRIVLMDFSATRAVEITSGEDDAMAGTPLYMAPELFGGERPSTSSDIYALGVLLFFLVVGQLPSRPDRLSAALPALRDMRADVPDDFVRIVERATETDRHRRHPSAGQLERALRGRANGLFGLSRSLTVYAAAGLALVGILAGVSQISRRSSVHSLAVLPMRNETGDPSWDYLCAGATQSVIERLSQLEEIRVLLRKRHRELRLWYVRRQQHPSGFACRRPRGRADT